MPTSAKNIPVLYEDKSLLIFNKPAGIMVHADGRSKASTVADFISKKYPKLKGVGEPFEIEMNGVKKIFDRPGIVHRIDEETSGVLVVAKTEEAFRKLKAQFKNREVKKVYRALVYGHVKNDTGIIDAPIGRSKKDFRSKSVPDPFEEDTRGVLREAVTRYKVLNRFFVSSKGKKKEPITYVEVFPETGRTHQIRVHFKSIRHPIVDDPLYGPKRETPIVGRTALHAYRITIFSPQMKVPVTSEAPLPKDMATIVANMASV